MNDKRLIAVVFLFAFGTMTAGVWARQASSEGNGEHVKTFDIVASQFEFEPGTIKVVQGDSVRLRVRSTDRSHGVAIKGFRVKAVIPESGAAVTVQFVADRAGAFDITCSEYCGRGHAGMKGRLIVVAKTK